MIEEDKQDGDREGEERDGEEGKEGGSGRDDIQPPRQRLRHPTPPPVISPEILQSPFHPEVDLNSVKDGCWSKTIFFLAKRSPFVKRNMGFFLQKFDTFLNRLFYRLGGTIARHTGYFILIPLFITALFATGFQQITYEDDPEYLFAPTNGKAKYERAVVEEFYKINFTSSFHPSRVIRNGRFARFIFTAKDGGDLLREDVWDEIMKVDRDVHDIVSIYEGRKLTYADLCAVWDNLCWTNHILDVGTLIPGVRNGSYNLTYPFMLDPNTFESYVFPLFFGGMVISNHSTVESAEALTTYYWLRSGTEYDDKASATWETALLARFKDYELDKIFISEFTSRTLETELENNTNSVIPYFGVTVVIMMVFCLATVTMSDCVRSKTLLGLAGVVCAGLSCVAAFGMLIYIGVPFIGINMAAPFLMLGIGIDDTFVMLAAWRRSRLQDNVPDRLAHTFADAAVSITITSITDMISFFIGATTPFPSVQIFCTYTGAAVLLTYLWHITLFGACLALSGYAEQRQMHNVACIPVKPYSESKDETCLYRTFCSGGISETDPWNPEDNKRHAVMVFFKDYVARFLNIPAIKAFVVMVFMIYLLVAIWGCTMVNEGLEKRKLSRYDSYSVEFYELEDEYFRDFPYRIMLTLTGDYNYSDTKTQDALVGLLEQMEDLDCIADSLYTESWLRSWLAFMSRNGVYLGLNNTDEQTFIDNLKEYYLGGPADAFALDVIFNEDESRIVASRFIIQAYDIRDAIGDRNLMEDIRRVADESPLNITVYHPFFIFFDQFTLVTSTSIQAICLAAGVMMIISLIFIPNPLCSLWVGFSIISIEIGVVGYMTLWGVNLDSISMIQLIMCIGFSVDFSAHISYAYLAAKVDTPDERVRECLYALGLPIVQGALSTILGIMPLVLAPSYIFITFFKTVFLVIFFGAVHGIFLLPVLLSLMGPGSCKSRKNKKAIEQPHPMYQENGGHRLSNGGQMVIHSSMQHPGNLPLHSHLSKEKAMHIPRPKSMGPLPNNKVITTGPVVFKAGVFHASANGVIAKEDSGSIERDLGLGTSGEESSESSLRQGIVNTRKQNEEPSSSETKKKRSDNCAPIMEVYSNTGYVSDDFEAEERRARERRGEYFGEWDNLQHHRSSRWQSARYAHDEEGGRKNGRRTGGDQHQKHRNNSTSRYDYRSDGPNKHNSRH